VLTCVQQRLIDAVGVQGRGLGDFVFEAMRLGLALNSGSESRGLRHCSAPLLQLGIVAFRDQRGCLARVHDRVTSGRRTDKTPTKEPDQPHTNQPMKQATHQPRNRPCLLFQPYPQRRGASVWLSPPRAWCRLGYRTGTLGNPSSSDSSSTLSKYHLG
jgi:hypothetical protein